MRDKREMVGIKKKGHAWTGWWCEAKRKDGIEKSGEILC
jgi:hypothetical protein